MNLVPKKKKRKKEGAFSISSLLEGGAKYPANKPELKKKSEIVVLFGTAISVQVTISTVSISILKERPKSKIRLAWGPLCSQVSLLYTFFLYF